VFPFPGQLVRDGDNGTGPKAYLNYLLFDRDYVYKTGGFKRLTTAAIEQGTDVTHERLFFENNEINITEAGYLYVWLSNENDTPVEVYFDDFKVTQTKSPVVESQDFYPFGLTYNKFSRENALPNRLKLFQGQEHVDDIGLNWDSFKWRNHQPDIGRFFNVDPLASDYVYNSPYAFSENHVTTHIELEGLEKVYIFDTATRPKDNGTKGSGYTAQVYVQHDNGEVYGPYSGSSYPNSKSNTDNSTSSNTVNEGEHTYNNESGHKGGTKKGLNIVNENGVREAPGTNPAGDAVTMTYVNAHKGASDNGNYNSRGSEGCITIKPEDFDAFVSNFDWSKGGGNKGTSSGTIVIYRADSDQREFDENALRAQQLVSQMEPEVIEN
jgi:RHS repeat-associated protein